MLLYRLSPLRDEIDRIYREHYCNSAHQEVHDFYRAVVRRIRKAYQYDRVDVTPLVRCRECEHYNPENYDISCDHPKGIMGPSEDDFCSYGKRREQNE